MSAKLLRALTDDNSDLQKQIGCMTGIFQLFDRQQIINGHSHKRLLSDHSHINNGNPRAENYLQITTERNLNKNMNENRRISVESSRASFSSSSCSSSFSSLDCNKTAQSETPSRELPVNQTSASPRVGRHLIDFREVVKDSIYRDAHGLSVKTRSKDEEMKNLMKQRDSPRLFQLSKSVDEVPWHFNEAQETPRSSYEARDEAFYRLPKDSPRFSYDGHSSFKSRETFKGATKLREPPRLSLDSRESSIRGSNNSYLKSTSIFKDLPKGDLHSIGAINQKKESELGHKRPPSVVAKLMGLEALPSSISVTSSQMGSINTHPGDDHKTFSSSSKQNLNNASPKSSLKDSVSPRLSNSESIIKPISSSRSPIEPAPWKKQDRAHGFQKEVLRSWEGPSVYREIEKKLKELEFKNSDKNIQVLKQILEVMTKKEEDRKSNTVPDKKYNIPYHTNLNPNSRLTKKQTSPRNHQTYPTIKGSGPLKNFESPIVIMKPAIPASSVISNDGLSNVRKSRSVDSENTKKGGANNRASKDLTLKQSIRDTAYKTQIPKDKKNNGRILQSMQTSAKPQQLPKENTGSFGQSSGSLSPRLQQKKLELDKRSRPPNPSSDSSKPRKYSLKQKEESSRIRILSRGEEISTRSDSNISSASQGSQSPSWKAANNLVSSLEHKKPSLRLSEDKSNVELAASAPEQPSPVSVLDDSFYRDDLPSPVEKISDAFKDDDSKTSDDNDLDHLFNGTKPFNSSDMTQKKLQSIENLVQKLRRLNSNHNEATTDYIASLCEDNNPDQRYISEMMLASGLLLRDLGSGLGTIQLHSSGYPISPDLFFVLEKIKGRKDEEKVIKLKPDKEKLHRKLVFDAVNEILLRKFSSEVPLIDPWLQAGKQFRRKLSAHQLLKELSSEIDQLQLNNSASHFDDDDDDNDFNTEVSGVVLYVERLIFKDLVDEIVSGESAKTSRHCRQLFYK